MIKLNNKHYQSCKWVMLPTDGASRITLSSDNKLYYFKSGGKREHLYILSDEEIKELP